MLASKYLKNLFVLEIELLCNFKEFSFIIFLNFHNTIRTMNLPNDHNKYLTLNLNIMLLFNDINRYISF